METIRNHIEEARLKLGKVSYQKTMEHLGMKRQQWTAIKNGSGLSDKNALRLGQFLKIDPLEIIAISKALRAENREIREYWAKIANSLENQRLGATSGKRR